MKIVLRIGGKDKTFLNDFVTARNYRNALDIFRKIEATPDIKDEVLLDELMPFVVSVFNNQFTVDDVWDGIQYDKISIEMQRIFHTVLGVLNDESEDEEGNEAGKQATSMPMSG